MTQLAKVNGPVLARLVIRRRRTILSAAIILSAVLPAFSISCRRIQGECRGY